MVKIRHDWTGLKLAYYEKLPEDVDLADEVFNLAMRHILLAERMGYNSAIRQVLKMNQNVDKYLQELLTVSEGVIDP